MTDTKNTGDQNTGDWNTGFFNTTTPNLVLAFNSTLVDYDEFFEACPSWLSIPSPLIWVVESDMSDQEKVDNLTFHTCGGYLRKNDMTAEWASPYAQASPEDVQRVRDLPGFDAAVFQEITGLDLSVPNAANARPSITMNGVKYVMAEDQS